MKNKRGFTLIELLAVVILIAILLLIAVPAVSKYLNKGTTKYYNSLEDSILMAGRDYLNDYNVLLPREIGNVTVIPLNELVSNDYIDEIVDSNNDNCDAKVTVKKVNKNKYEYYACLECKDYSSNIENCSYREEDNITSETKNYTIEVEKDTYTINQGDTFELPMAKAYYLEQLVYSNVMPSPRLIDTNKLGTTTVTYAYQGAKKQITVKVIDQVNPSIPQVVLKYDDENGKRYKGEWYNANIYVELKSTDYVRSGLKGSGISHYEISTDQKTWQQISGNNYLIDVDGDSDYYVKSIDKAGNESEINSFNVKIDSKTPECKIIANGKEVVEEWFSNDVELSLKVEKTISGIFSQSISTDKITDNTTGEVVTGMVTNNAGVVGTCTATIKVDKIVPTISANDDIVTVASTSTKNITDYFTINFSPNGGTTTCKVGDNVVTKINDLELGINTVTCTATSISGLTASASITIAHTYTAQGSCSSGTLVNNSSCYFSSNSSVCGVTCHYGCETCYDECATKETIETCVAGYVTTYIYGQCKECGTDYNNYYCKTCTKNDASGNLVEVTDCNYCGKGYRYAYCNSCPKQEWSDCATKTSTETCKAGNVQCKCDNCKTTTANSCNKTTPYLSYSCPTTGKNNDTGEVINATLNGTTCSFQINEND